MKIKQLFSVVLFAALLSALISCNSETHPEEVSTDVLTDSMMTNFKWVEAGLNPVKGELKLTGKIQPQEDKMVKVAPLVDGIINKLEVKLGDHVQRGQTLAIIRSADVADADDQLESAEAALSTAKKKYELMKEQQRLQLASAKDVDYALNDLRKAEADLKKAKEVTRLYGMKESLYVLKAPISGFIIDKNAGLSNEMPYQVANTGPFFTISELENLDVWADVFEADIGKVKQGDTVQVLVVAHPEAVWQGVISRIQDIVNDDSRTMKVRISIPNKDLRLKPDMFTQIVVPYAEQEKMTSVPVEAIIFDNNKNYVLVWKGGRKVEVREVELYRSNSKQAFLAHGLKAGEKVILSDLLLLFNALYK